MESDLRYPIGTFHLPPAVTSQQRLAWIRDVEEHPLQLQRAIHGLSAEQLDTPYRPGGWTVRQVVHHLPDSHLNAYTRIKLALTEETPAIKPYEEARWAELEDSRTFSVEASLRLLDALHERWVWLLRTLSAEEYRRGYWHPEHGRVLTLEEVLGICAWHGRHHVAQIISLRERRGW
jgi:uncharacterized damage-inducible protein DinB